MNTQQDIDPHGWLARMLEPQADWRRAKAAEYPEDERNARASDSLHDFMAWIRALPGDDPRTKALSSVLTYHDAGLGEESSREVSRYGFDGKPPSFSACLTRLVVTSARDERAFAYDVYSPDDLAKEIDWYGEATLLKLCRLGALAAQVEEEIAETAGACHANGIAWEAIAAALSIQRQTAQKRYEHV